MRPLVVTISIFTLLLHFTCGCCAHAYSHTADAVDMVHSCDGHDDKPTEPATPCPTDSHDEHEQCQLLVSGKLVSSDAGSSQLVLAPLASWVTTQPVLPRESRFLSERSNTPALPLRAHLWYQTFLI